MVDRGNCTFVQKVRNAQRAGAAGVVIADNTCLCKDLDCMAKSPTVPREKCEMSEPIMADDGSGSDVSIPSFLMTKLDSDAIKAVLKKNQTVQLEMKFSIPAPDNRVEYDLWTTPKDITSREFQKSFQKAVLMLGEDAYFTPHMYVYNGITAGCQGPNGDNQCMNLCTNQGRYCSTDPDDDLFSGASGADVVTESLRRLCIWQLYGTDGIGAPWWKYVQSFMEQCDSKDNPKKFTDKDCIAQVMSQAGIDQALVDNCMTDSGGLEGNVGNTIFDEQLKIKQKQGVFLIPSLYVNQAPVRGHLSFSTAFKAICAGYAPGSQPAICVQCAGDHDEDACVEYALTGVTNDPTRSGHGISKVTFACSMFVVVALFVGLGVWNHNKTQRDMRDQVRGILADYIPLEDQDAVAENGVDYSNGNFANGRSFARHDEDTSLMA